MNVTVSKIVKALEPYFVTSKGNNAISGNLTPDAYGTVDLGSIERPFRRVYAIELAGTAVSTGGDGVFVHLADADTITVQHTFDVSGAPFALGASAQGQTVVGLKSDQLNKSIIAGSGLTGGGALTGNVTLDVGAGTMISVAANSVGISTGSSYQFIGTGSGTSAGWRDVSELAGNGLSAANGVLAVSTGALISIVSDAVSLSNGTAQYQVPVTGVFPYTPDWTLLSSFAGNGIGFSGGAFVVGAANTIQSGAGAGITQESDGIRLTASYNPGASSAVLASDSSGRLTLPLFVAATSVTSPIVVAPSGNSLTLQAPIDIVLDPTSDLVRMGSGASIQASSYASQTTGWRITDAGEADFRYLFVDEMHAKSFIADLEQALAGGQIIAKSVAMVAAAFTLPAAGATGTLRVRDLPSAPNMAVFQSGDFVGLRQFSRAAGSLTISWAWGTVTGYVDGSGANEGTQTWTFTRHATTPGAATGTIAADSIALDFGVSGNGFYEVNAIDGAYGANSPYAQVVTWSSHPATQTVRARFGHLRGIFSVADEFGLYAGSGTSVTDRYVRASSQAVELRNVPLALYDGTNNTLLLSAGASNNSPFMALGATLPTGPLVNNGIWLGKDGSDYEFRVGTVSGGALVKGLHWDGSNLVWKATNTSLDASGNLTASNATLSGQVTATSGAIGGWTIAASGLTATNIGLYSGAANTARVQVGTGTDANTSGLNSANGASDIAFWAGSTHANRASAPFRVTAGGAFTATTGTVAGDFSVSGSGKLIAGGSGVILDASGISLGMYTLAQGANPATPNYAVSFYSTPSTRTGLKTQIYTGDDSGPYLGFVAGPELATPAYMTLWNGGANRYLWFQGLTQVVGMPGLLLATGSPNTVQVLSGARLQLNSGSSFVATAHLQAGVANTYDIGEPSVKWRKLYVQDVVADTISGTSMSGATWRNDASDMYIYSSAAGARTLYVANDGAGVMGLNVEGDIALGGLVDGVDLAAFKSAYDIHNHDSRYYTETELATSGSASVHWNNLTNKPTTFAPSSHVLATTSGLGAEHTVSGLTTGYVLRASSATTAAFAQLAHSDLSGVGVNSHTQIDTHIATSDTHIAHSGVTLTAGDGLTGGGTIAASRTFTLGTPSSLTSTSTNAVTSTSHTHAIDATIARAAITLTAGNGLTGGGDLSVNRTFTLGTPSALSATTTDAVTTTSHTHSIATAAAVTLAVASSNAVGSSASLARADHTHAITTSSNPGAAASILATDASGYLQLVKLGIGASASAYGAINISGSTFDASAIRFLNSAGGNTHNFRAGMRSLSSSVSFFGISYDDADYASDFMAVRESGNVGIGTTSPESKLHVSGSARLDYGGSYIIENTVGNAVVVATVNAGNVLVIGGSNINAFQIGDNDAYIASTGASDARQMVFYAGNAAEAMRINASGYLGVGMSAPEARLHVRDSDAGVTFTNMTGLAIENSGSSNVYYALAVKTTGAPNALSLTNAGYLGLGTSSPGYQLDMTGNANIAGTLYVGADVEIDEDLLVGGTVLQVSTAGTRVGINRVADSQFDLDVAGAIRGQYLVGRHAIQLPSAVGVWHFDGPQPYSLDFTGAPESHAGVAATVTNGIYRPGRFGKALQIAPATTNYVRDPSFETAASSTSSESPYFKAYNLIGGSSTQSTDSLFGGYSQAISVGTQANPYLYRTTIPDATLAVGQTWTFSAWVKAGNQSAVGKNVSIRLRESGDITQTNVALTREWQRISVTRTLTVAVDVNNYIIFTSVANSGDIFLVDGVQLEQKPYATPFAVGDMGDGHSWTSTAFTTPSIRAAGSASFGNVINRNAFTVAGWLRPLLSEDDTTSLTSGFKWRFQIGTYNSNPSLTVGPYFNADFVSIYAKNTADASWSWYAASTSTSPNIDFAAGEWIFVAVTWNGSEVSVYATKESNLDIWDSYTKTGLAADFFGTGSPLALSIPGDAGNDLWDEVIVLDYAADEKLLRSIAESDAPVFVESSVFHWRSPSRGAQIWVDEFGLWGRTNSGDAMLGLYGGSLTDLTATTSWAGVTLGIGDLTLGSLGTGAVFHWDNSEGAIRIGDPGAEHIFMDGSALEFRNSGRTWAYMSGNSFVMGEVGGPQVGIGTAGMIINDGSAVDRMSLIGSRLTVGSLTATSASRVEIYAGSISMIHKSAGGVDTTYISLDASGSAYFAGTVSASAGDIGGWTIESYGVVKNSGVDATSAGMAPADYPFYAGKQYGSRSSAPFRVTAAGALYATGATISGAITATSGEISGALTVSGNLTVSSGGGIYQGTGTFSSPTSGVKMWNNSGAGRLAGYNGSTEAWALDYNGLAINAIASPSQSLINFNFSSTRMGGIGAATDGTYSHLYVYGVPNTKIARLYVGLAGGSAPVSDGFTTSILFGTANIDVTATGTFKFNSNTIWHAGNDGTGSALDADLLDGNHASAFALSSHTHTGVYAPVSHTHSYGDISGNGNISTTGTAGISGLITGSNGLTLQTGGTLTVRSDADVLSILGRAAIGYNGTDSDVANFAHYDQRNSASNFGMQLTAAGATILNAASGQTVSLRVADTEVGSVKSTGLSMSKPIYFGASITAPTKVAGDIVMYRKGSKLILMYSSDGTADEYFFIDVSGTSNVSWTYSAGEPA